MNMKSHSCCGNVVITHVGCIAASVGRAFSRVCLSVCALKGKRLERPAWVCMSIRLRISLV